MRQGQKANDDTDDDLYPLLNCHQVDIATQSVIGNEQVIEIDSKTYDGKKQGMSYKVVPDSDLNVRHTPLAAQLRLSS